VFLGKTLYAFSVSNARGGGRGRGVEEGLTCHELASHPG